MSWLHRHIFRQNLPANARSVPQMASFPPRIPHFIIGWVFSTLWREQRKDWEGTALGTGRGVNKPSLQKIVSYEMQYKASKLVGSVTRMWQWGHALNFIQIWEENEISLIKRMLCSAACSPNIMSKKLRIQNWNCGFTCCYTWVENSVGLSRKQVLFRVWVGWRGRTKFSLPFNKTSATEVNLLKLEKIKQSS